MNKYYRKSNIQVYRKFSDKLHKVASLPLVTARTALILRRCKALLC